MKILKHYLNVYRVILRLNRDALFSYRANFINSTIAHSVWAAFTIISMFLLTSTVSNVFGWTRYELLVLAGVYNIVMSVFYFFFSRNFSEFSNNIHYGRLDSILAKPINSQFLMTFTFVGYTHIIRFILGIGFTIYILQQMHAVVNVMTVILFIIFLILSIIILYSLWMMTMTLTIWYTKLSNLVEFLYEIHNVAKFPQEIYRGASIYIVLALFPLTLVIVTPVKVILNKIFLGDMFWPVIIAFMMFFISRKFWKFALRSYTSASG